MATHSSVLAWRIPGTGEPGGLPSTGSHRVGHELYLIGVLIFISLRTYDVEHLFRCLFSICISFFGYIFVKVFGSFFNEFFFFSFLLWDFKVSFSTSSVCFLQIFFSQSVTLSSAKKKF